MLLQRGVLALRVEVLDETFQRLAQQHRRVDDRVAGVVGEQPELDARADAAIVAELVDHLRPAARAGRGAVHEDHRDGARTVGQQRRELGALLDRAHALQEAADLALPDRRLCQRVGQRGRRLGLERHRLPFDLDLLLAERLLEGELPADAAGRQLRLHVLHAQHRRDRHLGPGLDVVGVALGRVERDGAGGERCTDAGPAIAGREPLDVELGDGHELDQLAVHPVELGLVEVDVERAERHWVGARARQEVAVRAEAEAARDAAVVEIRGNARAPVERVELGVVLREQEQPRVHRGRAVVGRIVPVLGVGERDLGEREDVVAARPARGDRLREVGDGTRGIVVEARGQVVLEERVPGPGAEACRRTGCCARADAARWSRPCA